MRWFLLTLLALAGLATPAAADDISPPGTSKPSPPAEFSDVQDLVYLRGNRPVLLRMHVRVDGKPFAAVWETYIDQLFAHLDVNGDGVLDPAEAGRAPRAQTLLQNQQGRGFLGQFAAVDFKELQSEDGKVTRAKLAAYYRRAGFGMFQLMTDAAAAAEAATLSEVLFKALDRDGDGKLSKEELRRAADSLRRFDVDDNETITIRELAPVGAGLPFRQPQRQPGNNAFVAADPQNPVALGVKLLETFDKDKDRMVTRQEIGLDERCFEQLDINGDGELDADELAHFTTALPPDGEFTIRLGRLGAGDSTADAVARPNALPVKKAGERLDITLGTMQIDLYPSRVEGNAGGQVVRQFLMRQFKGVAGKKGYVEKNDLQANVRFLGPVFPLADRDGDGKLTEKELIAFLDVLDKAKAAFVVLTVTDRGHGLFDALDTKRDGRLRFHELGSAWDRVASWDREGKGSITRREIPTRVELNLTHGLPNPVGRVIQIQNAGRPVAVPREPAKGPLWFRKMDRNGDGVVSLREWLSGIGDFQRLDSNHDGVIDLHEAEKADAILRTPAEQKP